MFSSLTNTQTIEINDIKHTTVNYVDYSTSIISSKTATELQSYLNPFYKLLESYYNINFLKINPNKTKFLQIIPKSSESEINYTFYQRISH